MARNKFASGKAHLVTNTLYPQQNERNWKTQ